MALITVLATLLFVSLIGITILQIALSHSGLSYKQISRQRSYYAVQAGLEHAMWRIRNNEPVEGNVIIGGLQVNLTRTSGGHPTLGNTGVTNYTLNATVNY